MVLDLNGAVGRGGNQLPVGGVQFHPGDAFLPVSIENAETRPPGLDVPQTHGRVGVSRRHLPQGGVVQSTGDGSRTFSSKFPSLSCQAAAHSASVFSQAEASQVVFAAHDQMRRKRGAQQQEGKSGVFGDATGLHAWKLQPDGF